MALKHFYFYLFLMLAFLQTACNSLLYYPSQIKFTNESRLKTPPKVIFLTSKDDPSIHLEAWHFQARKSQRKNLTLVFFHGNGQNISTHFHALYWIVEQGYNFIIFDYPGYGSNAGSPTPENTVAAGKLAIQWVSTNYPTHQLAVFGQSLGGNVALRSVSEMPKTQFCMIAIESSFLSYKEVAQSSLAGTWITWPIQLLPYLLISDTHAINSNLGHLPASHYLVIHGDKDQVIPLEFGQKLFQSLPKQATKEFWRVAGGKHINAFFSPHRYRSQFLKLLDKNCP